MSIEDALNRYGRHEQICGYWASPARRCTCGFSAALKRHPVQNELARYGNHHDYCRLGFMGCDEEKGCDCGLRAAINRWPWDAELWERKLRHRQKGPTDKKEVMDLDEALDRYGEHLDWCASRHSTQQKNGRYEVGPCDCGYEALVNGIPWNPTYWRVKLNLLEPNGEDGETDGDVYNWLICGYGPSRCEQRSYDALMAKLKKAAAAPKFLERVTPMQLERYGQHENGCNTHEPEACHPGPCNCGLRAAIRRQPWNTAAWEKVRCERESAQTEWRSRD